jgi:hypothetical protein
MLRDDDGSDEFDVDSDGADSSDDLMECPYCREPIYEDAQRCPHCEKYLSREDALTRTPVWILVCGVLALGAAVSWVFMR